MSEKLIRRLIRESLLHEKIVDFEGKSYNVPDEALDSIIRMLNTGETPEQWDTRTASNFGLAEDSEEFQGELETREYIPKTAYAKLLEDLHDGSDMGGEVHQKLMNLMLFDEDEWNEWAMAHDDEGTRVVDQSGQLISGKKRPLKKKSTSTLASFNWPTKEEEDAFIASAKGKKTSEKKLLRKENPYYVAFNNIISSTSYDASAAESMKDLLSRIYLDPPKNPEGKPYSFEELVMKFPNFATPGGDALEALGPEDRQKAPTGEQTQSIEIPPELSSIMNFAIKGGGKSVGKGEFVIPLMFQGAQLARGSNAEFDVSIEGVGYHVKEANPQSGIKFGSKQGGTWSGSDWQSYVKEAAKSPAWNGAVEQLPDVDAKEIIKRVGTGEMGNADPPYFQQMIQLYAIVSHKDPDALTSPNTDVNDIYENICKEARNRAVGDGYGTIWATGGSKDNVTQLEFLPKASHFVRALTQSGRYILASEPLEMSQPELKQNAGVQRGNNMLNEDLIREYIREALLTEAFTKTDERAIETMARKEIDKKWKKEYEKKIDKMFDDRDKTLFRNDAFYKVIARIYQELQRAYAEDQFKYATRYTRKDIPLARFRPS